MKSVVIVKMWALGDIVMATPLLSALRERYPEVKITWVADKDYAGILAGHPLIDTLYVIDSKHWRRFLRQGNLPGWVQESGKLRQAIAQQRPDAVINCHPEKWWTIVLCPAAVRVGLYPTRRPTWTERFYTHALNRPQGLHNTRHYLMATDALECPCATPHMSIGAPTDEGDFLTAFRERNSLKEGMPVVVLSPFSTGDNRNWEDDRYAALADWLTETYQAEVVLPVSLRDQKRAKQIAAMAKHCLHLAEDTTLRQYLTLLHHADLVLCVDSSAMHLAAALQRPFVALFGPTPVGERFPLVTTGLPVVKIDGLACAPCDRSGCSHSVFRACMKQISLEQVQQAITKLLSRPV